MQLSDSLARDLLDAAPDAKVITNQHGAIELVNAQTEAMFGYSRAELVGQSVEMLIPDRYKAGHPKHREGYSGAPRKRPMGANLELYGRRRDGSEFPVEISLSPLQTEQGLLISSAIRDVTDRKQMLEDLKAAQAEADKANAAKSSFLAAASHDLRQPLQTLMLLNNVLSKVSTDPRAIAAAKTQRDALNAMSELINALLDISRLDSGTIQPRVEDFPARAIFQQLKSSFEEEARAKGLTLMVDDCPQVIRSDKGLLEQVVQNLVANAIRYTPRGKVTLRCVHESDAMRIEVKDTGIGIPENKRELIFEEFAQLNAQPGEKREGLGLGLAIVRRIARLLQHDVHVDSAPGYGSTFSVIVPYGDAAGVATEEQEEAILSGKQSALILLVDDDPAVSMATKLLLEIEGHQVVACSSMRTAIDALGKLDTPPDLVVSDFHLGRAESGVEVIQHVRQATGTHVPALLVTGDTSPHLINAAQRTLDCQFLSKPVVPDEFLQAVDRLLRGAVKVTH